MIFLIDFPSIKFIIFTFEMWMFFIFNFIFLSNTMTPHFIEKTLLQSHIFFICLFRHSIRHLWSNGFDKKWFRPFFNNRNYISVSIIDDFMNLSIDFIFSFSDRNCTCKYCLCVYGLMVSGYYCCGRSKFFILMKRFALVLFR